MARDVFVLGPLLRGRQAQAAFRQRHVHRLHHQDGSDSFLWCITNLDHVWFVLPRVADAELGSLQRRIRHALGDMVPLPAQDLLQAAPDVLERVQGSRRLQRQAIERSKHGAGSQSIADKVRLQYQLVHVPAAGPHFYSALCDIFSLYSHDWRRDQGS